MNHKRGRNKNRRAGCKMCKRNKLVEYKNLDEMGNNGFSRIKGVVHQKQDLKDDNKDCLQLRLDLMHEQDLLDYVSDQNLETL